MRSRTCLTFMLLFTTVGCDQLTKAVVRKSVSAPRAFFGGMFVIERAENPGAFLSLGSGLNEGLRFWIFTIAVGMFLFAGLRVLFSDRVGGWWKMTGLALLLAGGFGNLIDRIFKGTVTDFLFFEFGCVHTGIFNFADIAIVTGIVLLVRSGKFGKFEVG